MPFAGFEDFADCLRKTKAKHPDWDEERCSRYCGAIKHKVEDKELSEDYQLEIETGNNRVAYDGTDKR